MKRKSTLLIVATLMTLLLKGCYQAGTLGSGIRHQFICTRAVLQHCLGEAKKQQGSLEVPIKWKSFDNWDEKGYEFLDGETYYFSGTSQGGDRMYYVTLVKEDLADTTSTSPSYLAVRSIFSEVNGKYGWKPISEATRMERDAAEERIKLVISLFPKHCNCVEGN